jgi:two-component system cell cycle sensor histidine kinase/response regulator CckA
MRNPAGTILLADDDDSVRWLTSQILKKLGFAVIGAASGWEALQAFKERSEEIEVVLSDVVMPGLFGPQLVRKLQEIRPEVKFVLMSGNPLVSIETDIPLEQGINFLQKPFSTEDLKETLELHFRDSDECNSEITPAIAITKM